MHAALAAGDGHATWSNDIPGDLEVDADGEQLLRILVNLGRNAVQALEGRAGGQVTLSARRTDDGASFFGHTAFVEPDADLETQVRSLAGRLSNPPPLGAGWHLERAYGFAGKGARRLTGPPTADDMRWLRDSLTRGGILVEPWVPIVRELSLHGFVGATSVVLGEPCALVCNEFGAPSSVTVLRREPGTSTTEHVVPRLRDVARTAAESLRSIGYFGPFGIDAFVFRGERGEHLNPLSDLNARFTLGWSTGMGERREAALAAAAWPQDLITAMKK